MVCFCRNAIGELNLALPALNVSASASLSAELDALAALLGPPAPPWAPSSVWLDLELPSLSLSASAMATISAFAQLRASVLAQFGIDLLIPGQVNAFIRLVATLNARLQALGDISLDVSGWVQLAMTLEACIRIDAALAAGLDLSLQLGLPGAAWQPFLLRIQLLLPLIAASLQLGLNLSANFTAELSAMLRVMLGISLPPLGLDVGLSASLTAGLSAIAQLRVGLGVAPLQIGFPAIRLMVAARVQATLSAIARLGLNIGDLLALPSLQLSASLIAPPAVVSAAMSINASAAASLNWQVPVVADLPVLAIGLPAVALTAQLSAALDISAAVSPCGALCDASSLLRASLSATAGS